VKQFGDERNTKIFIYALGVLAAAILFLAVLLNFGYVTAVIKVLLSALKPVVYAMLAVFCVNGVVNMYKDFFSKFIKRGKRAKLICKIISVTLGYLTFIVIIAAMLIIVFLPLASSYSSIIDSVPSYIASAKEWVRGAVDSIPFLAGQSDKIMEYINDSLNFSYDSLTKYAPVAMDVLNKIISEASNMFLGFIISVYIIFSTDYITRVRRRIVHAFLSEKKATRVHDYLLSVYGYFSNFISGRLFYSIIVGIAFYIALWIMNVPLYSFISLLIGVLTFIPVAGTVIAFGITVFFVFITSYDMTLLYAAIFVAIMLLGYFVLQGKIIKDSVRASVTASLVSVLVMYGLFGVMGALMAVPVYLSVKLAVKNLLNARENRIAKAADGPKQTENDTDGIE